MNAPSAVVPLQGIVDNDMPALFRSADHAAIRAQKLYVGLIRGDLILMCLGAAVAGFTLVDESLAQLLAWVSASIFFIALLIIAAARGLRREQHWYAGRAVAESVKTLAWRYMMRSEPFGPSLSIQEADQKFIAELDTLLHQYRDLNALLGGEGATGDQISQAMRNLRSLNVEQRKHDYLKYRIDDQRKWYSGKNTFNAGNDQVFFWATALTNLVTALSVVLFVKYPTMSPNMTGFFAALSLAFLAWTQTKQFGTLAQAYGVAAHELGLIRERSSYITTDEQLSDFVTDSENAISREHTLWLARRERV